uniref:integrator complex subunit 10-like n=1 Tax=Ciona intestinalis TaxID=7719 RepID=UPI000180D2DD|nr:integrator complex subunit 10-like [Ciona intestinalis]|eukprot:XP_026692229.1 integrator complex subunit 10-like [Ciona intestinalis]
MNSIAEEAWFLRESKKHNQLDIYQARSWLLTAKCMFPLNFDVQMQEYELELSNRNLEECAKVLNEIFRDFVSETKLWEEIELLIHSVETSTNNIRAEIFEKLPSLTQQRMIISSAERRVNITQYCRLIVLLMKKFPETTSKYGILLAEKLVETEKRDIELTPVNHCRKLLVREVLPVICRNGDVGVSHRHFYKWLQKSTEFYAVYFTNSTECDRNVSWSELEELRSAMAGYCNWAADPNKGTLLVDRSSFIKDLFRRSRTDIEDTINRKQIFYTTIILLMESSSKHMQLLESQIRTDSEECSPYILIECLDPDMSASAESSVKQSQELRETFHVAKDAWVILHSNETFEKDFHHLARRWKCEKWFWLQLFLIELQTYEGNYKAVMTRLMTLQQKTDIMSNSTIQRLFTHLVSTCFALGQLNESCSYIFKSLPLFPLSSKTRKIGFVTNLLHPTKNVNPSFELINPTKPVQRKLRLEKLTFENLISFWVQIFLSNLKTKFEFVDNDIILGHALVFSQHDWPKWKQDAYSVLRKIEQKGLFNFSPFCKYIINMPIIEEIAYLKKEKGCKISLESNLPTRVHVTRGANREVEDDFWNSIKRNVQRSCESVDSLLREYLISCQNSLTTCLSSTEQ